MTRSICRREFLAVSAATAAMVATRRGWAKDAAAPAPATGRGLNDYCVAEISTAALKNNLAFIRSKLKPKTKFCAVVKANCFSHGWLQCKDAIDSVADWVAVATPGEAFAVRQSGWRRPILLLMASGFSTDTSRERLRQLVANDITLTVAAPIDLAAISAAAEQVGKTAKVHIKIDTGMTRSGIRADEAHILVGVARRQSGVALTGLYTHYAVADAIDKTVTREQLAKFHAAIRASGKDAEGAILHTANSAATLEVPEAHLDMVRTGTAMYGIQPSDQIHPELKPILRLVGRLAQVKEVPAGSRVGYGHTYQFDRAARIGLVPIGYADGYRRCFSNRAVMRVAGQYVPVRGRVCMDQTIIDLTTVPSAKVGDEVEIISSDPAAANSIENLARLADTIAQEIASGLGGRVERVVTA